jgi:hypothetical protein
MNNLRKNMRWLSAILVLMFFGTIGAVIVGHAITHYTKTKETPWYNNQVIQEKPFRIQM